MVHRYSGEKKPLFIYRGNPITAQKIPNKRAKRVSINELKKANK